MDLEIWDENESWNADSLSFRYYNLFNSFKASKEIAINFMDRVDKSKGYYDEVMVNRHEAMCGIDIKQA